MKPHLLVDISSHGYGHVSLTAPVVNELSRRLPNLRVTVRSTVSASFLRGRIACAFDHIPAAFDFGMRMQSAIDVDVAASAGDYRAFHADWEGRVAREAEIMRGLRPDLLLANVPYLSLAAAEAAGIRAAGLCCLNWADIYRHYCADEPDFARIHRQMLEAYNGAAMFLRIAPAMEMAELTNVRSVGPVARVGSSCRASVMAHMPASVERLVLIAMGGIDFHLPLEHWPRLAGVHYLVPQAWDVARADATAFESLGMSFSDLLASCDAVVTKPGYGTFAEAACAGVPVLYVSRGDWPEEPGLVHWLGANGVCLEVKRERLMRGELGESLASLWQMPRPVPPLPDGAVQAAEELLELF